MGAQLCPSSESSGTWLERGLGASCSQPQQGIQDCRGCRCRALKAGGLCQSVLYGLPLIVRPTNCWQLSWEELEGNQQRFQALCLCLGVSQGRGVKELLPGMLSQA